MPEPSHPPRPEADAFRIPDREAWLRLVATDHPELAPVREALNRGDVAGAGVALARHIRNRAIASPLLADGSADPRHADADHAIADACLNGRLFDGYNWYDIPPEGIDWRGCPLFCITRFPIFPYLLRAYRDRRDPRYLRFIVDHTLNYMRAYPIDEFVGQHSNEGYVNHYVAGPPTWWCLCPNRLEEWTRALCVIRRTDLISDEELLLSLHRMHEETRYYLTQMPYWVGQRHNVAGFAIRVIGLLCELFADFTDAAAWREQDARWLADYIEHGFYPDGMYKELAIGYSISVSQQTAVIASALLPAQAVDEQLDRLRVILEATVGLSMPDRRFPNFGDHPAPPLHALRCSALTGAINEPWLDHVFGAGADASADPQPPFLDWPPPGQPAWSGYYVMRSDWSPDARYLMIDGGPWGTTHQHMDKLSFELAAHGACFITDPGNTTYANNEPDARLSTLHAGFLHNVLTINGVDEFVRDASEWATDTPLDNRWEAGENWVLFEGAFHFAPELPVTWRRRVLFVSRAYWLLQDVVTTDADAPGEPLHAVDIEQNFQFDRSVTMRLRDDRAAVARAANAAELIVMPLDDLLDATIVIGEETSRLTRSTQYRVMDKPREFGHGRGWMSRMTRRIEPAPALVRSGAAALPWTSTMALIPVAPDHGSDAIGLSGDVAASIERRSEGDATVWTLPAGERPLTWRTSPTVSVIT